MASNALAVANDPEWAALLDNLVEGLKTTDIPEQVIEATEMLLSGFPTTQVAKELGVKPATVKGWIKEYPPVALAVARKREMLMKWRMSKLEQQWLMAMNKSEEILRLDLEDRAVNAKLVGTVAQHARFMIGLLSGQKIDVNVHVEGDQPVLKAQQDALNYLADRLQERKQDEAPIEATYRVVDENPNPETKKPLLNDDGGSPFGEIGLFDTNEEGTVCHVCGKRVQRLAQHASQAHNLAAREYELMYMVDLRDAKQ